MPGRSRVSFLTFLLLFALIAVMGIITSCYSRPDSKPTPASPPAQGRITTDVNAVADAVEKIGPGVVSVNTEMIEKVSQSPNGFSQDPFFNRFFGNQPEMFRQRKGQGSGFIINSHGYILTNQHVIGGARTISVTLTDGREFKARPVGSDNVTDVALLKIDADNLPVAEIGDSAKTRIGEWVIAVGNPFGYENTVTVGVLSGRGRRLADVTRQYEGLLQTDAAINPGNSGGPLCDLGGRVIGINTAIIPFAQGIGFAIPIDAAMEVADVLMQGGSIQHAYLGIVMASIADLDENSRAVLKYNGKEGVVVTGVFPDSPAQNAGIAAGDIIIEIDRQKIKDSGQLRKYVMSCKAGQDISIVVIREGVRNNLKAPLAERPDNLGM